MGKFIQTVVKPATEEEKKAIRENILANFTKFKNPLASQNPFSDGEELEFDAIVPVSWKHEKWGDGQYLALAFKGKEATIALSSFVKEVNGFASLDVNDTVLKPFKNVGGLADVLKSQVWDKSLLDKIDKFFTKHPKVKVKLTTYYVAYSATQRKTSTLTNIIVAE